MKEFAALVIIIVTLAQLFVIEPIEAQIYDSIQKSGQYVFGIGESDDFRKADIQSLDDLEKKLETTIKLKYDEISGGSGLIVKSTSDIALKTYSIALLSKSESKMEIANGVYHVVRFISKNSVKNIFSERENKIRDMIKTASEAEKDLRIGDALCYFYWSYTLLLTLPTHEKLEIEDPDGRNVIMEMFLQDKINSIFSEIVISPIKVEFEPEKLYKSIQLKILYRNRDVENIDYTFYSNQSGFSPVYQGASGNGLIELSGETSKLLTKVDLFIEYEYKPKAIDEEVKFVLDNVKVPGFKKAHFEIIIPDERNDSKRIDLAITNESAGSNTESISETSVSEYRRIVSTVLNKLKNVDTTGIDRYFSPTGWDMYKRLFRYGRVTLLQQMDTLKIIKVGDQLQIRTIPMGFNFQNSHKKFVENVVFTFDTHRKTIDGIAFGLGDMATAGIVGKSSAFASTEEKYQIIKFLESYKTAYALKNIDYISKIFADNALIIIGNLIQEDQPIDGMYENAGNQNVRYIRLNKKDFIDRLAKAFRSNEFINIRFEESTVKRVNSDDKIFGIQLGQYYESSTYHDFGYLFLMIDLKDSMHPKIYVRTWQPRKNPDGSIFGLGDFDIY